MTLQYDDGSGLATGEIVMIFGIQSVVSMPNTVAAGTCYLCLPVAGSKLAPSFSFSQDIFPETSPRPGLFAYAASWSRVSPSSGSPPDVEVGSHLSCVLVSLCPCEFHTSRLGPVCLIRNTLLLPSCYSLLCHAPTSHLCDTSLLLLTLTRPSFSSL